MCTGIYKVGLIDNDESKIMTHSIKKRASRATALRADGEWHTRGLVLTPWTSPNPWTWP